MKAILALCLLSACSPYAAQLRDLDRAYMAGRIPFEQYRQMRNQAAVADQDWRAQQQSRAAAGAAAIHADYWRSREIQAYQHRTSVMGLPRTDTVHLYHHRGY